MYACIFVYRAMFVDFDCLPSTDHHFSPATNVTGPEARGSGISPVGKHHEIVKHYLSSQYDYSYLDKH